MRINPCGYVCEYLRRPYRVRCRPFQGSDVEVVIRWYAVPPGTPMLPVESCIVSLDWDATPWIHKGVGEVYTAPRRFAGWNRPPVGVPDHYCGTRDEWEHGVYYRPDLPAVEYTAAGLPTCCVAGGGVILGGDGLIASAGGVLLGGHGTVHELGGVELGGEWGGTATPGGVELGGEWDVIPPPGTSCSDAPEIAPATDYPRTVYPGIDQWYAVDMTAGTWRVSTGVIDSDGSPVPVLYGGTCPSGLVPAGASHTGGTDCWSFGVSSSGIHWLRIPAGVAPVDVLIRVESGGCP